MKHFSRIILLLLCIPLFSQGTQEFSSSGEPVEIDFSDYTGTGISGNPDGGGLNSNNWSVLGMSDGDIDFGGNSTSNDFEGQTAGEGVSGGGLYALVDDTNGLSALWVQPTSSDFTPGSVILRLQNATDDFITRVECSYTLHTLNDGERSNSFNLSYSTDGANYYPLSGADFASDEAPDGQLSSVPITVNMNSISLANGDYFYLRWTGDDVSGSGARDEFGLDNISITPITGVPDNIANFGSTAIEVSEASGEIFVQALLSSPGSCELEIGVSSQSTASQGADFANLPTTYTFNNEEVISIPINIFDDAVVEETEVIVLEMESITGEGCVIGGGSQVEITIQDNDSSGADGFTIAEVTETTATGAYLFEGQVVELTGTVIGINLRPEGLQFTLWDGTGGIGLFSLTENFGYTVNEGDVIRVEGTIGNFLGLGQIFPSVLEFISSGGEMPTVASVLTLDETTESELVSLEYVELVDPLQWVGTGSDFTVDITNGIDTYQMRIDNQVDLFNSGPIGGVFSVVGIGGQNDPSAPFTEGYIIQPRSSNDIVTIAIVTTTVSFDEDAVQVNEADGPIDVVVNMNLGEAIATDCVIDVAVHPSSSATSMADFTLASNGVTIAAGATSQSVTVTVLDDEEFEEEENIWLAMTTSAGECQAAIPAFKRISIIDNDEPELPSVSQIGSLTQNDEVGVPVQNGAEVTVEGVVYGTNLRPGGLQFTVIDNTGGIGVFYSGDEDLGYTVNEGDQILMSGTLGHYSGLTQINPSFIQLIDTGGALVSPSVSTNLDEQTESELVSLGCVSLVDPTQWNPGGPGFNVDVSNGFVTRTVRIDADVDLFNLPAPEGNFLVVGIGGQFDQESPFDSGYQLLPRYAADIDEDFCPNDSGIADFGESNILSMYPNPAQDVITLTSTELIEQVEIFNVIGRSEYFAELQSYGQRIALSNFTPGIYFVKVKVGNNFYQTRFLKN